MNIKRLMDLGCYRGLRHRRGLPVRGQRTHTNARTRKGPARPIAGKKKVRRSSSWPRKPLRVCAGASARTSPPASPMSNATFNNTMITITDAQGNAIAWSSSGSQGFKGWRKSHAVRRAGRRRGRRPQGHGARHEDPRGRGQRPGLRAGIGAARAAGGRLHDHRRSATSRRSRTTAAGRASGAASSARRTRPVSAARGLEARLIGSRYGGATSPNRAEFEVSVIQKNWQELIKPQSWRSSPAPARPRGDHRRRAARARLRHDARQRAAPHPAVVAAGCRRHRGRRSTACCTSSRPSPACARTSPTSSSTSSRWRCACTATRPSACTSRRGTRRGHRRHDRDAATTSRSWTRTT